jgi:hypothetical protein
VNQVMRYTSAALMVALSASCSTPTASCGFMTAAEGQWSYRATRESPEPGVVTGTLRIESPNCVDLRGAMDVVEVLASGATRRIAGPLSGTIIDSGRVRFEVVLGTTTREHFARIIGDSLAGSWIEIVGVTTGSGPFSGRREVAR